MLVGLKNRLIDDHSIIKAYLLFVHIKKEHIDIQIEICAPKEC